ncbi:adenosylcobalamin-dependent ribonucleoside-diphosphate reductase [bacterium]|nr:adenosylcobalamin-dependent ribonucleoside-diphosphate reductase [bacterium]
MTEESSQNPPAYTPENLANIIFQQRYAIAGEETWDQATLRVANHVAAAEHNGNRSKWSQRFHSALRDCLFIPGGRIFYGSGRPKGQLLNCFVVPTDDSREGWGKTVSDMLIISGTGGGVGINFTPIRPRGTPITGTGGEATGAVSLMEVIDQVGEVIKAGGGRRTALMLCLDYNHGDIREFLFKKFNRVEIDTSSEESVRAALSKTYPDLPSDAVNAIVEAVANDPQSEIVLHNLLKHQRDKVLRNANVSINVDEAFFEAIRNDEDIVMTWRGKEVDRIAATELWDLIARNAWESGEPGILNRGLANKMNNIWYHSPLISTNPCGEIWLEPYGCCDLGAINLSRHINEAGDDFDWDALGDTVTMGVRFLDNVLDVNTYPLPEIEKNCQQVRRIGLGVLGMAHALVKIGVRYDRAEGRRKVDQLFNFIKKRSYEASTYLAAEKGAFPVFDAEKFLESGFCQTLNKSTRAKVREYGIRNCAILTIAPTGTTSMVAATSSGIEPIFAPGYKRRFYAADPGSNDRILKEQIVVDPLFQSLYEAGADLSSFVSSHEVDVESHLKMQAICQKHIDNAVSKTINLPNDYDVEDFKDMLLDYAPKLKGTTIYRSGSRGNEPLTPLTVDEAVAHLQSEGIEIRSEADAKFLEEATSEMACPDGVCDIATPSAENVVE